MEHLNDSEIFDFLFADTVCENTMSLGKRINSHILCCAECAERYRTALAAAETVQAMLDLGEECCVEELSTEILPESVEKQVQLLKCEGYNYNYNG